MSNTSEIKRRNLSDIIKVIWYKGAVTKPEIVKSAKLTLVTVHNYITELMDKKLVTEAGNAGSNGGRKAILYRINPDYGFMVCQNLGTDCINTLVYDMGLNLLYRNKFTGSINYNESIIKQMVYEIELGIKKTGMDLKKCVGIGISVPGQVEHAKGIVMNLTKVPGWKSIPVKSIIEEKTGISTYVDNDSNANTLAIKWMNIVRDKSVTAFVDISNGVGMGVLIDGRIFYGSHTSVGEIGHTSIQYDGPLCRCGNYGCIEVMASDFTIIEKVRNIKGKKAADQNGNLDIDAVIHMAKSGDSEVYDILKETCRYIGMTLDHIVKLYGPEVIVLENHWLREFDELYNPIVEMVFDRCMWVSRESFKIMFNTVDDIQDIGAAALILENIFDPANEMVF